MIQDYANTICREFDVPTVPVRVTNKKFKNGGLAVYFTFKYKGQTKNYPKNILILNWETSGELICRLAHELAHHILNCKYNSLAHSQRHGDLEDKIGLLLSKIIKKEKENV